MIKCYKMPKLVQNTLQSSKISNILKQKRNGNINGWQLAKMKKSIPDMSMP